MAEESAPQNPAEGRSGLGVPSELGGLLQVAEQLRTLQSSDWASVMAGDSKPVVQVVEQIMRTAKALQVQILAAAEASGGWALDGQRNFNTWVTEQTGSTQATASKDVRLAKSLHDDLPHTRKALAEGLISADHAQIIARQCTKTDAHRKRLADPNRGEQALVEQAQMMNATKFTKVAKSWAIETDPKGADRDWKHLSAKEELSLTVSEDGYYLSGFFNHVHGAILDEALRARMGRKPANDTRSYNERRAEACIALAQHALDSGALQPTARIRPHLTVTVQFETLQALVSATDSPMLSGDECGTEAHSGSEQDAAAVDAWVKGWKPGTEHVISSRINYERLAGLAPAELPDGTPLPHQVLSRLACESMLTRVVFGPQSTVLDVGREQRIFTTNQTRAIIARDRVCQYPACDENSNFSEVHHSISWAKHQGNTDVDLGILLCFHHHRVVHERDISIVRREGRWLFFNRRGKRILPPNHAAKAAGSAGLLAAADLSSAGARPNPTHKPPSSQSLASPHGREDAAGKPPGSGRAPSPHGPENTAPPTRGDSRPSGSSKPTRSRPPSPETPLW